MTSNSPLFIVFNMVVNFATWLVFLRLMLQFADIDKKHPYVTPAYKLTKVVDVFAHIFPNVKDKRISLSAIMLLLLLAWIKLSGNMALLGESITALQLFFVGTVEAVLAFLTALKWLIIISVILSFIVMLSNKMHPVVEVIMQMADPIIEPFRRITPTLGMLDFSPLVAVLVLGLMAEAAALTAIHLADKVW